MITRVAVGVFIWRHQLQPRKDCQMKTPAHLAIAAAFATLAFVALVPAAQADDCNSRRSVQRVNTYDYRVSHNVSYDNGRSSAVRERRRMIRNMMSRFDYNEDGYISRHEARASRRLRRKFRRIDRNRDGYIARHELRKHIRKMQRRSRHDNRYY